jgi:hypothetical protein
MKLFVILILSIKIASAQNSNQAEMVKYSAEYLFKDGIFLDFNQVKNNNPILKNDIVFVEKYSETEFYERILDKKKFEYKDANENILSVASNQIWGYSQNGTLYIRWNSEFYRIFNVARFSHFVVYENVYVNNFNDPFMTTDPFMTSMNMSANMSKMMKQYVLDFETGNIMEYNTQTLFKIMSNDEQLSKEYSDLSNRKKRQLMFLYLRKYNDKYPLYLLKL